MGSGHEWKAVWVLVFGLVGSLPVEATGLFLPILRAYEMAPSAGRVEPPQGLVSEGQCRRPVVLMLSQDWVLMRIRKVVTELLYGLAHLLR